MQTSSRYPWGRGRVTCVLDTTANDSDKTFTVPTGRIWRVVSIYATLVATAVGGNRVLRGDFGNGAAAIWYGAPTSACIANNSTCIAYYSNATYSTSTPLPRLDTGAGANGNVTCPIPEIMLLAGYTIRIWDTAAIDPAADDLTVSLQYIEYDA